MERYSDLVPDHSSACFRHLLHPGGSHCALSCTFVINCFEIIDYSSFSSETAHCTNPVESQTDQADCHYKVVVAAYSFVGNFTN